ncbi:SMC family ATPase [Thermopolyspora sp. NPDC052614]|uniref:SMC family ATPase n=1 Tax=Thermopolyspora sp. NPDC052614 TaxID=3155682 RepID=UPI00341DA1BA
MRPLRLHLENFGSFREPVTVDFNDVDYFALVGPTGAGKSTVIDAICFALYGTVPRWGRQGSVAHALAPSATSGKVALVFETGDRRHAVVRALRRDAKNVVHTKEARLDELDPSVPATADLAELLAAVVRPVAEGEDVTAQVQRVTGLEYRFFTQCVVLPQGRFAEFLHAPPRERQDLLVQLLDADVYARIRERAVQEEAAARQHAEFARGQLSKISNAGEGDERAAAERLDALRVLRESVQGDLDALRSREESRRRLAEAREATAAKLDALNALAMPAEVESLAEEQRRTAEQVTRLTEEVARLEDEERRADDELAALGDKAALAVTLAALNDQDQVRADLERAEAEREAAESSLTALAAEAENAAEALAAAERERDRLRDAHQGAALAHRLVVGEPCPTCLRPVTDLPEHAELPGLRTAERELKERKSDAEQAAERHRRAEAEARDLARRAQDHRRRLAELAARAGDADPGDVRRRLDAIGDAERRAAESRWNTRAARASLGEAERLAAELRAKAEQSWRDLDTARDTVVALGAPPLDREDLGRAWAALLAWREQAAARERGTLAEQDGRLGEERRLLEAQRAAILRRLAEHDVTVPADTPPDRIGENLAAAVAEAKSRLDEVKKNRERARELAREAEEKERQARVAHELELLLRANQFERWLCGEAMELLVADASETLRELSNGQYELVTTSKGDLEVIDYAEAGMRRSARTLSGGETFQASLALALALSRQVAGLAATAARTLDSIFLDEGFGTLDPTTLDTVATTLERLATGQDRMVGVVTHVPALADRVPVRFEITRDARGSHVRKVTS